MDFIQLMVEMGRGGTGNNRGLTGANIGPSSIHKLKQQRRKIF